MPKDFSPITELPGRKLGRERIEIIGRRYLFAAGLAAGKRVLEVGCGPGLGLGYLAGVAAIVVAGDVTTTSLAQARATYRGRRSIRLLQFDAHALPFREASFDLVLAMAMMNYLDAEVFLTECQRVLTLGGILAFCMPNKAVPGFRPSKFSTRYYSPDELIEMSRRHGFELELFGAFPAPHGRARVAQRAIALAGTVLAALAFAPRVYEPLKDFTTGLIGYERHPLTEELTAEHLTMVATIPLDPLGSNSGSVTHRIIYGVARKRGDAR